MLVASGAAQAWAEQLGVSPPSSPPIVWTDKAIERALRKLANRLGHYPTRAEIRELGGPGLATALHRDHRLNDWRERLGHPRIGGPTGPRKWTPERIEATVTAFVTSHGRWPTRDEWRAAGLGGLRDLLARDGTTDEWIERLGVAAPTPNGPIARWSDAAIERALRSLTDELGHHPTVHEIRRLGPRGLARTLERDCRAAEWRRRLGAPCGRTSKWTPERIEAEVTALVSSHGRWPTYPEWRAAGLGGLRDLLTRTSAVDEWIQRLGVQSPLRDTSRRVPAKRWDDAAIESALRPLIADLGRWPSLGELRRAGLGGLAANVDHQGTSGFWAERFGVVPTWGSKYEPAEHLLPWLQGDVRRTWLSLDCEATLDAWVDEIDAWPDSREAWATRGELSLYARLGARGREFWRRQLTGRDGTSLPPLNVSYDVAIAAAWRFARQRGHLSVDSAYRDEETGVALRRWIELTESRTSIAGLDGARDVAVVRGIYTPPTWLASGGNADQTNRVRPHDFATAELQKEKW